MSEIDRTNYESFRFWTPVTIRYSDQDSMGHVNNCAYAAYAEAGRTMFLGGLLDSEMHPSIDFILASVKIDYLKEIYYPGSVNIGTRILKLGTKSMTLGTGMFLDGEAVAIAESAAQKAALPAPTTTISVFLSFTGRRPPASGQPPVEPECRLG